MAGPWMVMILLLLLSDGGSAAVDQNKLADLIRGINNQYRFGPMFAVALSIKDEDKRNLQQIFQDNPKDTVESTIQTDVYRGPRFAAAIVKQPEHAEYRLLKDLELKSLESDDGDLLVFYSYASPCTSTCTNMDNNNHYKITDMIKKVFNGGKWAQHVWVYSQIFKPGGNQLDEQVLSLGLQNLATSGINLQNIFRCFRPNNTPSFGCTSCSSAGGVTKACVDYDA